MSRAHPYIDAQGESRRLIIALDGRVKLFLLLSALGLNLSAGGVRVPLLLMVIAFGLVLAAGVPASSFLKRMAVPALLALFAFSTQLFLAQGGEAISLDLGRWQVVVHGAGLQRGFELGARILGGMGVLLFFSLTTPLPELMRAARFFHCPAILVELAMIMYRYIFLLLEEGERIRFAQKARLGFVDGRSGLRSAGILGGMLVLRTYDRAERSFAAMRCRGYRGVLTAVTPGRLQPHDWGGLAVGTAVLLTLLLMR